MVASAAAFEAVEDSGLANAEFLARDVAFGVLLLGLRQPSSSVVEVGADTAVVGKLRCVAYPWRAAACVLPLELDASMDCSPNVQELETVLVFFGRSTVVVVPSFFVGARDGLVAAAVVIWPSMSCAWQRRSPEDEEPQECPVPRVDPVLCRPVVRVSKEAGLPRLVLGPCVFGPPRQTHHLQMVSVSKNRQRQFASSFRPASNHGIG